MQVEKMSEKQIKKQKETINLESIPMESFVNDYHHGDLEFPVFVKSYALSVDGNQSIRWHWHDEIELIYIDEGSVEIYVENTSFIVPKGQAIFVNQNVLHSINIAPDINSTKFRSLIFHPSFLFGYGRTLMAANFATPLIENHHMRSKIFTADFSNDFLLLNCLAEIFSIMNDKKSGYELLCKALLCKTWYLLLISADTTLPKYSKSKRIVNDEVRIKNALLYIETHYAENISLEDIADSIHISKSECCRCFKRILHMSPFDYLLKFRIFSATKMIQRHDEQITSIGMLATSVGFSNISYFNKVFKKYLNMTPSEYREKQKVIAADETLIELPSLHI